MPGHALVDIQNTFGCTFIGLVISILFFGITVCQTWIYFWRYAKRDPKLLKLFILAILLLDTFHTILSIYSVYWYLILNFGNAENLGYNMWAMNLQVDITGLVDYLVQLYYARRVYIVSKSIIIPAIVALLGANCFALGFAFTTRAAILKTWSRYTSLIPIICIGLGTGVLADALIAFSMCWFLYHKRTGFSRTDSMIMTLMSYSINSGLVTCILTTAVLITFSIKPASMIWQIFFWPMAKVYANSLLAMLNSRDHVRVADKSTSRPTAVSISVHHSETTDFPEVKHGRDIESSNTTEMRTS
ncbi:hypothetical protein V8E53_014588 [Lactarius tabidus]